MGKVMVWVNDNFTYDHVDASLQAVQLACLGKASWPLQRLSRLLCGCGGRWDIHALTYGINPLPKNSPSHCKLEAFLPPYGWVSFDVAETQNLITKIKADDSLDEAKKKGLSGLAQSRLLSGFRDNTWFIQTRGTDYDLAPRAAKRAAVVRTIYAEADGVALPEPDPANKEQHQFSWMTVHKYVADRNVAYPFKDWRTLEGGDR